MHVAYILHVLDIVMTSAATDHLTDLKKFYNSEREDAVKLPNDHLLNDQGI